MPASEVLTIWPPSQTWLRCAARIASVSMATVELEINRSVFWDLESQIMNMR